MNKIMKSLKSRMIYIVMIIILILLICNQFIILVPNEYDRAIYSIVIHNTTNVAIDELTVLYGNSIKRPETVVEFAKATNLQPSKYIKFNIPTNKPSGEAKMPYNVFVGITHCGIENNSSAGYFGLDTGGLVFFEITNENNKIKLKRIYEHERKYKTIKKRHYKHQNETSW